MSKKHAKKELEETFIIRPRDCVDCKASCCNHVAIGIDKPTSRKEYGHIRWYLSHKNVSVFIDHDDGWNVEFATPCTHLDENGMCSIYETRPVICREYPADDQYCVYETTQAPHSVKFHTAAEFEIWLDAKKINWRPKAKQVAIV